MKNVEIFLFKQIWVLLFTLLVERRSLLLLECKVSREIGNRPGDEIYFYLLYHPSCVQMDGGDPTVLHPKVENCVTAHIAFRSLFLLLYLFSNRFHSV